jgi:large subunit ribosomal protein L9
VLLQLGGIYGYNKLSLALNMKIILTKDVSGIGRRGEIKQVSVGYARNFLMPKGIAKPATSEFIAKLEKEAQEMRQKSNRNNYKWLKLKENLENKVFLFKAKTNKDRLFAAISKEQIVESIKKKIGIDIRPKQVTIKNPIKSLGFSDAEILLPNHLKATLRINVEAE